MKNNPTLTLLLTYYKQPKELIQNWIIYYKKILNKNLDVQFIIGIDGISSKFKDVTSFLNKNNVDFYINEKNVGKYWTVMNGIKNNFIKGKFVKACDPDDLINIKILESTIKKIETINENGVIKTPINILRNNYSLTGEIKTYYMGLYNWNTIYPTKPLKNIYDYMHKRYSSLKIIYLEDQLLSLTSLLGGAFLTEINQQFYTYVSNIGVSSPTVATNHLNEDIKNKKQSVENYIKQTLDTIRIFIDFRLMWYDKFSTPYEKTIQFVLIYAFNNGYSRREGLKLLKELKKIYDPLDIKGKYWLFVANWWGVMINHKINSFQKKTNYKKKIKQLKKKI